MRLVFVLCIFAMFGAQVFGSAARFVCDCGGVLKFVAASSCSGPHGSECHSDAAHDDDAHEENASHDGSDDGDRRHHEQETRELAATTALAPQIVVPSPVVLAILAEHFFFTPESLIAPLEYFADAFRGPPRNIALSRTVVLRI